MASTEKHPLPQYNLEGIKLESLLGPLEARLLEAIWSSKKRPMTVREVHEIAGKEPKLAYTTVMTTMNRLYEKGYLDRKIERGKGGLFYVYWPKMERESFERSAIAEVLDSLISNFGETVTACFVDRMSGDKVQLDKLKAELEKRSKKTE